MKINGISFLSANQLEMAFTPGVMEMTEMLNITIGVKKRD